MIELMQLTITKHTQPTDLTIRIHQDPLDPDSPLTITGQIWTADRSVLAACAVQLHGLETDFTDTIVEAIVHAHRWHGPGSLSPMMRARLREARHHARAHERT